MIYIYICIDAVAYHVPPFFVYGTHRYIQACCQTLPPPAIAWFAEPQAEERRECEPRSASKPSVTAASGSCRLKSAATWG